MTMRIFFHFSMLNSAAGFSSCCSWSSSTFPVPNIPGLLKVWYWVFVVIRSSHYCPIVIRVGGMGFLCGRLSSCLSLLHVLVFGNFSARGSSRPRFICQGKHFVRALVFYVWLAFLVVSFVCLGRFGSETVIGCVARSHLLYSSVNRRHHWSSTSRMYLSMPATGKPGRT